MKQPPAFRFYVDNFIEGTCDLTDSEVGLYIRLLCAQWSRGGLPNDDSELLRFSRGSTGVQPDLNRVKRKFRVCEDGLLRNDRLELERAKQVSYSETQSVKGRTSAKARFNRGSAPVEPARGVEPSVSVSASSAHTQKERNFPEVGRPTREEVILRGKIVGLAAWKAEDWFYEMEACGWLDYNHRPVGNWQAMLNRVRSKWEADGRPMSPPSRNGGISSPSASNQVSKPADPNVCVIGKSRYTPDKPPKREQFKDDSSFQAYHQHWQEWMEKRAEKPV